MVVQFEFSLHVIATTVVLTLRGEKCVHTAVWSFARTRAMQQGTGLLPRYMAEREGSKMHIAMRTYLIRCMMRSAFRMKLA